MYFYLLMIILCANMDIFAFVNINISWFANYGAFLSANVNVFADAIDF